MKKVSLVLFTIICLCACGNQNEKLIRIQENGLYGFIDSLGNVIIEPQYKYAGNFYGGYACIVTKCSLGKDNLVHVEYGYINPGNELVIDTSNEVTIKEEITPGVMDMLKRYEKNRMGFNEIILNFLDLRDDRFLYQDKATKYYGYKNSEEDIVIDAKFYRANAFGHGKAIVMDTLILDASQDILKGLNRFGAIDINGNYIIKPNYLSINNFSATNKTWACSIVRTDNDNFDKEWVLLDDKGNELIPSSGLWEMVYNSNEDLYVGQISFFNEYKRYTFVDSKGDYLSDYNNDGQLEIWSGNSYSETFDDVTGFSEGFAGIKSYDPEGKKAWLFYNKELEQGKNAYDSLLCFSQGLAAVKELIAGRDNFPFGRWGFVNHEEEIVIPYQFSEVGPFKRGLAYFRNYGSSFDIEGYINKKGEIVWQTKRKIDDRNF